MAPGGMDALRALRVLGLPPSSTAAEIRSAWLDLARVWHPDRFQNDERLRAKAGENLQRINAAYEALKNYDPSAHIAVTRRVRESVAIIFGIGDLGEPPKQSRLTPSAQILAPTRQPGLRRSLMVLGLGVTSRSGVRRSQSVALLLGGMVILLALLVAALVWLSR